MGRNDDDDNDETSSSLNRRRKRRRHDEEENKKYHQSKKKKSSKEKKKRRNDDDDEKKRSNSSGRKRRHRSVSSSDDHDDDDDSSDGSYAYEQRSKRRKKDSKKREKKRDKKKKHKQREEKRGKKKSRRGSSSSRSCADDDHDDDVTSALQQRNFALADALVRLFSHDPNMSEDLPIMLIRLANGASFDLSQMTDATAAAGLAQVLECVASFGVTRDSAGANTSSSWCWKAPAGSSNRNNNNKPDELVLVRVIRAVLNQIGLTAEAMDSFEAGLVKERQVAATITVENNDSAKSSNRQDTSNVERVTQGLLRQFGGVTAASGGDKKENNTTTINNKLGPELVGLCHMLLRGESIALDGLPDTQLREGLERLFTACGLVKSEMQQDNQSDSDSISSSNNGQEDDEEVEISMGYALPDENDQAARSMIDAVLEVCRGGARGTFMKRPIKGPMPQGQLRPGDNYGGAADSSDDDDDEGPALLGVAQKKRPAPSHQQFDNDEAIIKARAAQRSRQLERVKLGLTADAAYDEETATREEWMMVPGEKLDFLGSIKSGQPIRSRTFQAKSKANNKEEEQQGPVDASVQDEMNAILKAHEDARGPSLLQVHRQQKAEEARQKAEAAASGDGKDSWKWNRDKDLDAGRRVDKDALNMVFGSAGSELKNKFHGGFG